MEKVPHREKDKVYYSWLLRTSYREGSKIKHKTIANVSDLSSEALEILRRSLKGEKLVPAGDGFKILSSRSHGAVHAVLATIRKIGLDRVLVSYDQPWRRTALAMIVARVLKPRSKLFTASWWQQTTLPEELVDLPGGGNDPDDLYEAMDMLLERQEAIQAKLAEKHLQDGCLVLYDLSSTYLEGGKCPLAAFGHNRDGKKGKKQFTYGLLTNLDGCPVAVEVFPGNTSDPLTLGSQVQRLRERYHFRRVVVVGDRGMIANTRISDIEKLGYGWITALKARDIQRLRQQGCIQLTLFSEKNLMEIGDPERPGERLVVCRNPLVSEERTRKREELLLSTERDLAKIKERVGKGKLKGAADIGLAAGKVVNRWKVAKHFHLEIADNSFDYKRKEESIEKYLDGVYVIRSNVPAQELGAEQLVDGYKSLQHVEQAFRSMKTFHLEIRPVYHRLADRVRAHTFLYMLAYYVLWHMRKSLRPLLDDREKLSLQLLLEQLGSLHRHTVEVAGQTLTKLTEPSERQQQIYQLLGIRSPAQPRKRKGRCGENRSTPAFPASLLW